MAPFLLRIQKELPRLKGWLFQLLYSSSQIKVGRNFSCDSFPELKIDPGCRLEIGDNVIFRRNVEIRVHGKSSLLRIEDNCRIDRGVRLLCANDSILHLGKGTRVGLYSVFNGGDNIETGEKCLVSGFVYLQTSMHRHHKSANIQEQGFDHAPIKLHDDSWLGAHVVVLPGCEIGQGAVVGSNAVVNKSVEAGEIVGGVPAKVIKTRE
jgi:acetyltransferase-like isoleucine patch superfamily enzyme